MVVVGGGAAGLAWVGKSSRESLESEIVSMTPSSRNEADHAMRSPGRFEVGRTPPPVRWLSAGDRPGRDASRSVKRDVVRADAEVEPTQDLSFRWRRRVPPGTAVFVVSEPSPSRVWTGSGSGGSPVTLSIHTRFSPKTVGPPRAGNDSRVANRGAYLRSSFVPLDSDRAGRLAPRRCSHSNASTPSCSERR